MIIGDIETTEKVEYEDLLKNYYEKMEIIEEQDKEIERLTKRLEEAQLGYLAVEEKNKRLNSIIKEVREYIENHSITNMEWWITGQQKIECKFMKNANPQELLEILDKAEE